MAVFSTRLRFITEFIEQSNKIFKKMSISSGSSINVDLGGNFFFKDHFYKQISYKKYIEIFK